MIPLETSAKSVGPKFLRDAGWHMQRISGRKFYRREKELKLAADTRLRSTAKVVHVPDITRLDLLDSSSRWLSINYDLTEYFEGQATAWLTRASLHFFFPQTTAGLKSVRKLMRLALGCLTLRADDDIRRFSVIGSHSKHGPADHEIEWFSKALKNNLVALAGLDAKKWNRRLVKRRGDDLEVEMYRPDVTGMAEKARRARIEEIRNRISAGLSGWRLVQAPN